MFQVDRETRDAPKEPKSGNDNKASETKSNLQPKGRIESKLRCGGGSIALKHERESYERCPGSAEVTLIDLLIIRRWHDWYQGWISHLKTWKLEAALWRWNDNSKGIIADQLIRSEATRLARMIGVGNFRTSADWLSRFKTREKVVREMFQLGQCLERPQSDQTEDRRASDQVIQQSDESITDQSSDESDAITDLDIPKLDPRVVTAELNGDLHTVTVSYLHCGKWRLWKHWQPGYCTEDSATLNFFINLKKRLTLFWEYLWPWERKTASKHTILGLKCVVDLYGVYFNTIITGQVQV